MPSENLELVRSVFAAWERGDFDSADWADPEIEFVLADGPQPGIWTGHAGMAEAVREALDAWEEVRLVGDAYRRLDGNRTLILIRRSARGKGRGLEVTEAIRTQGAVLFHVQSGTVTRLVLYWDRDRAFADLGLAPDTGT